MVRIWEKKCNLNIYSTQWSISKCGGVRWQRLHCHLSLAEKDEKWFVVGRSAISTAKVLRVAISYYARLFLSLSAMLYYYYYTWVVYESRKFFVLFFTSAILSRSEEGRLLLSVVNMLHTICVHTFRGEVLLRYSSPVPAFQCHIIIYSLT